MSSYRPKISALGCYAPPGLLTNADLEKIVETNDEWILTRTGISQRHIASPEQATSDLATAAAREALKARGIGPEGIDAIIVCTVTPDMLFPATACLVQNNLGVKRAWGFDLVAACSGFVYGTTTAANMVASGMHQRVLVIGADTMSRILDYKDRATCVLFGDGAGAVIVERAAEGEDAGFIDFVGEIDGSGGDSLKMPGGGSRMPASVESVEGRMHYVHQEGQQVFKYAVQKMQEMTGELLKRNGLTGADINIMLPHQANKRIIDATAQKIGLPEEKVMINIGQYGNTTAGTIPLAARDAIIQGRLKKGDLVLMAAVGAGFTAGASLWRWAF